MGEFSLTHLLLFAGILLLMFGPSKLPGLGQALGRTVNDFKKGLNGSSSEEKNVTASHSQKAGEECKQQI